MKPNHYIAAVLMCVACRCAGPGAELPFRHADPPDHSMLIREARRLQSPEKVLSLSSRVIARDSALGPAWLIRGAAWAALHCPAEALADVRHAQAVDSSYTRISTARIESLSVAGKWRTAADYIASAADTRIGFGSAAPPERGRQIDGYLARFSPGDISGSASSRDRSRHARSSTAPAPPKTQHGRTASAGESAGMDRPVDSTQGPAVDTMSTSPSHRPSNYHMDLDISGSSRTRARGMERTSGRGQSSVSGGAVAGHGRSSAAQTPSAVPRSAATAGSTPGMSGDAVVRSAARAPSPLSSPSQDTGTPSASPALPPLDDCRAAAKHNRRDADAHLCIGRHYYRRRSFKNAARAFKRALKAAPGRGDAWLWRAKAQGARKKYRAALKDARRAARLRPRDPQVYMVQAWSWHCLDNAREEIDALRAALRLGYKYPLYLRKRIAELEAKKE